MITTHKFNQKHLLADSIMDAQLSKLLHSFQIPVKNTSKSAQFIPHLDVFETNTSFKLMFVLPGFKKENLKIEIDKNYLLLHGERQLVASECETKQHLLESFYGKFSRKIQLPEQIETNSLEAELADGILTIQIPKTELKQNKTQVVIK